ncbi:hypothetical protein DFQ27_005667 [Actinomortierella ambigua]|uniref:Uncharacterized protein n=1 Tax=Actinomortierella ambigua TaxID=1343610 RepID=A0A9P6Q0V5_9FUNG|nr:hypothetical protein DFQ27_005667 [Actinomortierella ambigua]
MLLSKSLLLLCSTVVVMARQSTRGVVSNAIFVGEDTSDPKASPVEVFKNPENHATAASSVVLFAAEMTGFTPGVRPAKSLEKPFHKFWEKVSVFPGFDLEKNEQQTLELSGSWTQMEEAIEKAVSANGAIVASSILQLAPYYILLDKSLDKWILSLVVFEQPKESHAVKVQLVHMFLETTTGDNHYPVITPNQKAKIESSLFKVNSSLLTSNAETFAQKVHISLVDDTINILASPEFPDSDIFIPACRGML